MKTYLVLPEVFYRYFTSSDPEVLDSIEKSGPVVCQWFPWGSHAPAVRIQLQIVCCIAVSLIFVYLNINGKSHFLEFVDYLKDNGKPILPGFFFQQFDLQ